MTKLSLKNLELLVTSQLLVETLLQAAKRDMPGLNQDTLEKSIYIAQSTLGDLLSQYQKRTNETKTEKLITRCQARIVQP